MQINEINYCLGYEISSFASTVHEGGGGGGRVQAKASQVLLNWKTFELKSNIIFTLNLKLF